MHRLPKFALLAWVGCAPLWAQSGSAPEPSANPASQSNQSSPSSQPAPDSGKRPTEPAPPPAPGDSTKLEAIKIEKAIYPLQAQEKQLQGEVWVKVVVSESGDVEDVEVVSGDPTLAEAAVHAARKWKFKPFIKNGKPTKASAKVPFDFAFEGNIYVEKEPPAEANTVAGTAELAGEVPKRVRVSSGVKSGLLVH
jgi:TonB family protein